MIGVIAVNEERTILRIGYLSFWGTRRNRYVEVSDVLPLTDIYTPGVSGASLLKFEQISDPKKYLFISTRNAEILEPEVAETIFGTTAYFGSPAEEKHEKEE
ncbi:hypothetical protein AAVH_43491 [Aphelenchoides avenae]|nr:hypothetical protein AAVH_43491 [Aphelenchus avenae]